MRGTAYKSLNSRGHKTIRDFVEAYGKVEVNLKTIILNVESDLGIDDDEEPLIVVLRPHQTIDGKTHVLKIDKSIFCIKDRIDETELKGLLL